MGDKLVGGLIFRRDNIDYDLLGSGFALVASERMTSGDDRKLFNRLFDRGGFMGEHASRRAVRMFIRDGGDVSDVQSFLDWLIANWPAILEMIKSIIALFTTV